jgi:hypothetical protein
MGSSGPGREEELAELLHEVRALRKSLDQLKAPTRHLPPDYAVLVRQAHALPPDYAVLVRQAHELPPDYAVAVRQIAVSPEYEVLVRPAIDEHEGDPARLEEESSGE